MVVPSHTPTSADKVALRRVARERRRTFVEALSWRASRESIEAELAAALDPVLANSRVVGGYCPLPIEISPCRRWMRPRPMARSSPIPPSPIIRPCSASLPAIPAKAGPWACFQPPLDSPEVFPDLVLVPLVAIDGKGTRLGPGQGPL